MTMLLTKSAAKLNKSQNDDVLNVIQYLEPDYKPSPLLHAEAIKLFGAIVCPAAGNCRSVCLTRTGRMPMINSVQARLNRTDQLFTEPGLYLMQLKGEITQALGRAIKQNKKLAVRLNGTSDLDFRMIYEAFPQVQFFEYTKRKDLIIKNADIPNVHYTFSYSENAKTSVMKRVSNMGINISVVFKDKLPATYKGIKVINGDAHDRRFEDEQGVIVGLKFKGSAADKAIAIAGGFAI
jgi:hypothetical protein